MVDRIKQIIEYYDLTYAQFADAVGINRSNLTHLFSGRNQPSLDLAKKILTTFPEIKTEWLIMGMGNMLRSESELVQLKMKKEPEIQKTELIDLFSQNEEVTNLIQQSEKSIESVEKVPHDKSPDQEKSIDNKNVNSKTIEIENKKNQSRHSNTSTPLESNIQKAKTPPSPIFNSQSDKTVEKIILFYTDKSFEIYSNE